MASWIIPTAVGALSSFFGNNSRKDAERAQREQIDAQTYRQDQLNAARYKQRIASYKIKLALVRSWLEQHPDIAAKAPKEYLQAVYNPQTSDYPVSMPLSLAMKSSGQPSSLAAIAAGGLGVLGNYFAHPNSTPPPGQPRNTSGIEGSPNFVGPPDPNLGGITNEGSGGGMYTPDYGSGTGDMGIGESGIPNSLNPSNQGSGTFYPDNQIDGGAPDFTKSMELGG